MADAHPNGNGAQSTELVEVSSAIRERAALIPVSTHGLAPRNLAELMDFGQLMAKAGPMVGKAFRGAPGSCVAITMQAMRWSMDPFAVSQKAYVTQDKYGNEQIGYEAQLINAVVLSNAPMTRRPQYTYTGSGNRRRCKVSIWLRGEPEPLEYETPEIVPEGRSPLWKNDLDQQLSYFAIRSWARRHMPELLMGVYSIDELQDAGVVDVQVIDRTGDYDQRPADERDPRIGKYGVIGGQAGKDLCDELCAAMSACEDLDALHQIAPQIETANLSANRTFVLNEHYERCCHALENGEECPPPPRFSEAPAPSPFAKLKADAEAIGDDDAKRKAWLQSVTADVIGRCSEDERTELKRLYASMKSGAGAATRKAGEGANAASDGDGEPGGEPASASSSPFDALKEQGLAILTKEGKRRQRAAFTAWLEALVIGKPKCSPREQAELQTLQDNIGKEIGV